MSEGSPNRQHNFSLSLLRRLILLALLLLLCGPIFGEAEEMSHDQHDHAAHQQMQMDEPMDHATAHVHPTAPPEASDQVGLDEKLGEKIPLQLTFLDEQGKPVTLAELIKVPTIIAPIYYKCPNVCSFLQAGLAAALPEVRQQPVKDFQVLSISFDETETPELARHSQQTYLKAMHGRFPAEGWRFLTGDRESIKALTESAGYHFMRQGVDFLHPVVVFVVTPDGTIVRYLHGTNFLPKDLSLALLEAKSGRVGQTIQKMVNFCFSYDPQNKTYVFNLLRVAATVVLVTLAGFLAFLIFGGKKKKQP